MHRPVAFNPAASVPVRLVGRGAPVRVEELEVMSSPVENMDVACMMIWTRVVCQCLNITDVKVVLVNK
jgi:hypothetical protein